ncbi:MAG: AI-2E family transporter [Caldilineaceae bacterium]|nr:AI-2E family transporter [Caldilineaceae bacterium]
MKQLVVSIVTTLSTLAAIWLLWQLRSIILLFVFSLAIAAALHKPVRALTKRRVPRSLAMMTVYGITLLSLFGFVTLISVPIPSEIEGAVQTVVVRYEEIRATLTEMTATPGNLRANGWRATFADYLPPLSTLEVMAREQEPATMFWGVLGITQSVTGMAAQVLLAIALSIYWTADQMHFERLWLSLLPPQRRTRMRQVWRTLEGSIGAYIRSEVLQSVTAGGLFIVGFYLLGSSYPYTMALLAAASWFIPLIGGAIGVILVLFIGLLDSIWVAGIAGLYTIGIFVLMEFYLEPILYRRKHYSAILVLLTMLALLYTLGLFGLLVAPPLALVAQILIDELVLPSTVTIKRKQISEDWAALQEQVTELRRNVTADADVPLRIQSLAERLDTLIAKANQR